MEQEQESFSYIYSAKQQEEVKRIRGKYVPTEPNKLEQLRRLDESAERPGRLAALMVGVPGTLLFGVGLCCTTLWNGWFVPGIFIGVVGLIAMGAAYPIAIAVTKRRRKKLAPEILRLSAELIE